MSFPDYYQRAEDHQAILILVKHIHQETSSLTAKAFSKIFDRIKRINEVKIQDAQGMGCERLVRLRFKKTDYEDENNEWGDLQVHRKVLGLITISDSSSDEEVSTIFEDHTKIVQKYSSTLLDSRCFILKPIITNTNSSGGDPNVNVPVLANVLNREDNGNQQEGTINTPKDLVISNGDPTNETSSKTSVSHNHPKKLAIQTIVYNTKINANSDVCDIHFHNSDRDMEKDIENLVESLFWVLESKRLDRAFEKQDRILLLVAPFENKTLVGVDTDTRNFKKRCLGRMKKHVADLSLLAGLPSEALSLYVSAISILKSVNDWLWLAAAFEGQCVASIALLYPVVGRRKMSLQRNASLPPGKFKQLQDNSLADSLLKGKKKFVNFNDNHGIQAYSLPGVIDPNIVKALGKTLLSDPTEIYDKYKEACCHYAKVS